MNEPRGRIAAELYAAGREHDRAQADRLARFRNVEPDTASYLTHVVRTLAPGGLLAVDNVQSHAAQLVEFTRLIEGEPGITHAVVPVGAGLRLAVRDLQARA